MKTFELLKVRNFAHLQSFPDYTQLKYGPDDKRERELVWGSDGSANIVDDGGANSIANGEGCEELYVVMVPHVLRNDPV